MLVSITTYSFYLKQILNKQLNEICTINVKDQVFSFWIFCYDTDNYFGNIKIDIKIIVSIIF